MPWHALEKIPGLIAPAAVWRERLGKDFENFSVFLQNAPHRAQGRGKTGSKARLTAIWELNRPLLSRVLSNDLGFEHKTAEFPLPATAQIGSWSADVVPAILTIQSDAREFRAVVAELVARLRQPFILLAPISTHLSAPCQELLGNVGAGFFALDSHVLLAGQGGFQPRTPPDKLFARFTPQPQEAVPDDIARQAVALVKALDAEQAVMKASVYTVFRLYCIDGLTTAQVAKKCGCARSLVFARLKRLRQKLGRNPAAFRQYAAQYASVGGDYNAKGSRERLAAMDQVDEPGEPEADD